MPPPARKAHARRKGILAWFDTGETSGKRRDPGDARSLVGAALEAARKQHGWTRVALARYIGVSGQAVAEWERGWGAPSDERLVTLTRLFPALLTALTVSPDQVRGRAPKRLARQLALLRKRRAARQ